MGVKTIIAPLETVNGQLYRRCQHYWFKEFENRTHIIIGQPGWEQVAEFVLGWLQKVAVLGKDANL